MEILASLCVINGVLVDAVSANKYVSQNVSYDKTGVFGKNAMYFSNNGYVTKDKSKGKSIFINAGQDFTIGFWERYNTPLSTWNANVLTGGVYDSSGRNCINFNRAEDCIWLMGNASGAAVVGTRGNSTASRCCDDKWHHFLFTRENGCTRSFVDGVLVATASSNVSINLEENAFTIGKITPDLNGDDYHGQAFTGYLDDIIVLVDKAIYTQSFDIPKTYLYELITGHKVYKDSNKKIYGII